MIQKLRSTEDMLTKKSELLKKKIDAETDTARKNKSKNKKGELCVDMILLASDIIIEIGNRSGCSPKQLAHRALI